jgi:hypothetical protein
MILFSISVVKCVIVSRFSAFLVPSDLLRLLLNLTCSLLIFLLLLSVNLTSPQGGGPPLFSSPRLPLKYIYSFPPSVTWSIIAFIEVRVFQPESCCPQQQLFVVPRYNGAMTQAQCVLYKSDCIVLLAAGCTVLRMVISSGRTCVYPSKVNARMI